MTVRERPPPPLRKRPQAPQHKLKKNNNISDFFLHFSTIIILIIARFYSLTNVAMVLLRSDSNSYSLLVGSAWPVETDRHKARCSMETTWFEPLSAGYKAAFLPSVLSRLWHWNKKLSYSKMNACVCLKNREQLYLI